MEVNNNSQNAQNALLTKLGISTNEDRNAEPKDEMGQSDFLKLMTAQMAHQDPFAPMDNGDFVAQMAQFSSVAGISEMNETMSDIAGQMSQFQVASSVNMLGHSVMMPGNVARADSNEEIQGTIDLARASTDTRVDFLDDETGESLHTLSLGGRASGLSGFEWTNLPEGYRDGSRSIRMDVSVNYGDGEGVQSLTPNVFAEVIGASSSPVNGAAMLEVEDYGDVSAADVLRFRL
jgi:flagellar basal-body rod modification protein FlgD